MGMTDGELLRLVELPLAAGVILAGVRIATVVSVGIATIARDRGGRARRLHLPRRRNGGRHRSSRCHSRRAARAPSLTRCSIGGASARVAEKAAMKRLLLIALVLSGCGRRDRIVVGAKNFHESDLLAEIVAQQIERRTSLPVERRLHLGERSSVIGRSRPAISTCMSSIRARAFTAILKQTPIADADSVYRFVAAST